jgi:hypothetical protein
MLIHGLCMLSLFGIIKLVIRNTQGTPVFSLVETVCNIVILERFHGRHIRIGQIEVKRVEAGLDA